MRLIRSEAGERCHGPMSHNAVTPQFASVSSSRCSGERVRVTEVFPSTAYPERGLSADPYLARMAAELPESVFPELVQDAGRWYLELRGVPSADDMGVHTFSFPVEQQPVGSGRVAIPAQVTLSVVSSTTPGYRAVLRGVPTAFDRVLATRVGE